MRLITDILRFLWNLFDYIILLQMGRTYLSRFREFSHNERDVSGWRTQQQREWDRLSTALALLTTMSAAILSITPHAPALATALWLGGAGLSACGLFIVNYFPFKSFSIRNDVMIKIVREDNHYINTTLLAAAVASPVIMTLWSAILFIVGTIDYIIEIPLGGTQYILLALIPIGLGLVAVTATLTVGRVIGKRVETQLDLSDKEMSPTF
ncbi:hypothetical protein PILCRDRAFT_826956 [Piloderma croceum F 1598]|uniref:Uncharacterized protein n=1 Tax=Piloderma croceum (strain F 1598) TaxID=765440 RepID=A0A0C3BEP9_PILCF|nr:hypothetical protein PILCRDRAFT_826956 [Piloderma croceum F 1598]